MNYKNFPMVPRVIFGRGSFNQLNEIISPKGLNHDAPFIFLVDGLCGEGKAQDTKGE